mmetsp:Transcript_45788/g.69998  ORF Transcript_45788/g.69998 Transcript_45788/m.69998 type:complete len:130 (+) Transcript_45788:103-492(+)
MTEAQDDTTKTMERSETQMTSSREGENGDHIPAEIPAATKTKAADDNDHDKTIARPTNKRRMSEETEWVYNFVGEIWFTISAVFFLWVSAEAKDWKSIVASLFFFIACIAFLIPMWINRPYYLIRENDT